jgi:hypothetical protein
MQLLVRVIVRRGRILVIPERGRVGHQVRLRRFPESQLG